MNIYNRILDPWATARQRLRTVFVSLSQFPKKALVIDSLSEKCNFPKRQNDMVK